ncbi:MAG: Ig-like domain repeat protein [Acidimicrobiales bacterium]
MHKSRMAHVSAILAAGAISLPLLASTTSAFAASPRATAPIGTQLARLKAHAQPHASVVSVTFAPSDRQGAISAIWTVDATTSATGALAIGATITIDAPPTTTFPSAASAYKVNSTTVTAIPSTAAGTVTIATPVAVSSFTLVTVVMTGVINPAAGTYVNTSFSVSTSVDTTASNPASGLSLGSVVSGVSFSPSSLVGAGSATWTVGFTASASGALAIGDTITISAPASTTFPSAVSAYTVNSTTVTAIPSTAAGTVTIATPVALGNSTAVSVQITGVTNPAASSYPNTSFSASTTADAAADPASGQTFSVGSMNTTIGLGLSSVSVAYGSETSEIFTVTVTGLSGEGYPEGTVAVYNSSTELCSAVLYTNGSYSAVATCSLTAYELAAGAYSDVFATYIPGIPSSSNSSYTYGTSSSSPVQAFSVGSVSTTGTTVSESPTKVTYGHESASVISVTVTTHDGGAAPNGEKVIVHVGAITCTAALKGGKGACRVAKTALPVGSYPVSAAYGGDANLRGSSGSSVSRLTVSKDTTRTSVSESPANVTYGHESASLISVAVTTRYGEAVPNGETVTVYVGNVTCTAALKDDRGNCRIATTALQVGSYPVLATYGGDANLSGSSVSELTVSKDTTRTKVSESPTSVTYGHESASVFSVTVTTRYGEAVPNGEKVTVHVGAITCTAVLKGGNGTCTIANNALPVGSYPVQATYGGDATLSSSSGSSTSRLTV